MTNVKQLVSDGIKKITPYVPGKPLEELEQEYGIAGAIKMASNENPLGPSPKAVKAIENHLSTIHRYPDANSNALKEMLSKKLGVDLPICNEVYGVLFNEIPVKETVEHLMNRTLKHELDGVVDS